MQIIDLLNLGARQLKIKNISSYKLDSEILLSKVLNKKRELVLVNLNEKVSDKNVSKFNILINRRKKKEPISYILREKEFWSMKFQVSRDTLIPRPETELMVEKLINIFKDKSPYILDIGTGSGCILISLIKELKNSKGIGVDISAKAITIANNNAKNHKVDKKIKFIKKSVNGFFPKKFDLIVSNPPYIMSKDIKNLDEDVRYFEPIIALDGGNDGLDLIKKVIYKAKAIIKVNGVLCMEVGNKQHHEVSKILINNNFRIKHFIKDYNDNVRCLISTTIK